MLGGSGTVVPLGSFFSPVFVWSARITASVISLLKYPFSSPVLIYLTRLIKDSPDLELTSPWILKSLLNALGGCFFDPVAVALDFTGDLGSSLIIVFSALLSYSSKSDSVPCIQSPNHHSNSTASLTTS